MEIKMSVFFRREISRLLNEALENMPVVAISGMRQTGKSTLLKNQLELNDYTYFTFDDYNTLEAAKRNPEQFIEQSEKMIIDEVQKLPELLPVIKQSVDRKRVPGKYVLSGSANILLLKNVSESLAGRAIYLTLAPFSRREILRCQGEPFLVEVLKTKKLKMRKFIDVTWKEIITGGMPSVCLGETKKPIYWFRGYEQTYLERDIRGLTHVADMISFRNLIQLVAIRNASLLNQSELSRDVKLNAMTTGRYLSLLETTFVINRIQPYLRNHSSRIIKSPKVYISDTGLAFHLSGLSENSMISRLKGALYENYVFQNMQSILSSHLPDVRIYYWNIQGRHEVDFIVENGEETVAVEVTSASNWQAKDLSGLHSFLSSSKNCTMGIVAYAGTKLLQIEKNIWAVPIALLLS
jgi:predicted AAA+ superfamily ATPase